jgi:uncharacterized RDD family membrane protein YckC
MGWYYRDGVQEIGPVSKEELQQLIKDKQINARTPVRSTEMTEWRTLSEMVRPKPRTPAPYPPSEAEPAAMESSALHAAGSEPLIEAPSLAVCSQCGRSFPQDQVLRYDNQTICAACKPLFVQRIKEGVGVAGSLRYAGFWIRFVAKVIDGIVIGIAQWAFFIPLGLLSGNSISAGGQMPSTGFFMLVGLQQLVGILIPAVYNTFFVGRFGATPGKMACRLRVVIPDGAHISYMRALGRNFAEWVSAIVLAIGYIMAAFDSEKRALHDRICDTRVVHK